MSGDATIIATLVTAVSALFAALMKFQLDRISRLEANEDRHLTIIADNNKAIEKVADTQAATNELIEDLTKGDGMYELVCDAVRDALPNGRIGPPQVRRRRLNTRRPAPGHGSTRARRN